MHTTRVFGSVRAEKKANAIPAVQCLQRHGALGVLPGERVCMRSTTPNALVLKQPRHAPRDMCIVRSPRDMCIVLAHCQLTSAILGERFFRTRFAACEGFQDDRKVDHVKEKGRK